MPFKYRVVHPSILLLAYIFNKEQRTNERTNLTCFLHGNLGSFVRVADIRIQANCEVGDSAIMPLHFPPCRFGIILSDIFSSLSNCVSNLVKEDKKAACLVKEYPIPLCDNNAYVRT